MGLGAEGGWELEFLLFLSWKMSLRLCFLYHCHHCSCSNSNTNTALTKEAHVKLVKRADSSGGCNTWGLFGRGGRVG